MNERKKKIFLWGTGYIARRTFNQCQIVNLYDVLGFIDNDVEKEGQSFRGIKIYSPAILENVIPEKIVVLTESYEEVYHQILNIHPEMESLIENQHFFYKETLLKRYEEENDLEIIKAVNYIKKSGLDVFNHEFSEKYKNLNVNLYKDLTNNMYYVLHSEKKMYFPKSWTDQEKIIMYYRSILMEQDISSPHRYLTKDFRVDKNDIVLDIGAAEGNFSLDIIDKVSKLYIIETDEDWIEALRETFKDYLEKVIIIKKYITSYNEGEFAALDSLVKEPVNFIKMDIEGNEWEALCGAKKLINRSKQLKCAICCYHRDVDEILIEDFLKENGFNCETTPGFMWYPGMARQSYISTKLNRGIVRGVRVNDD